MGPPYVGMAVMEPAIDVGTVPIKIKIRVAGLL
ncbi:hypothetical protein MTBSS4_50002 [Magnetospirillum sp. SS-4]|nr:hypothetical protein MTBSS4_50002 [Magnetospirillum sp. SS-4]